MGEKRVFASDLSRETTKETLQHYLSLCGCPNGGASVTFAQETKGDDICGNRSHYLDGQIIHHRQFIPKIGECRGLRALRERCRICELRSEDLGTSSQQPDHYGGSNSPGYQNWSTSPQQQRYRNWCVPQWNNYGNRTSAQGYGTNGFIYDSSISNDSWMSWNSFHVEYNDGSGPYLYTHWYPTNVLPTLPFRF